MSIEWLLLIPLAIFFGWGYMFLYLMGEVQDDG